MYCLQPASAEHAPQPSVLVPLVRKNCWKPAHAASCDVVRLGAWPMHVERSLKKSSDTPGSVPSTMRAMESSIARVVLVVFDDTPPPPRPLPPPLLLLLRAPLFLWSTFAADAKVLPPSTTAAAAAAAFVVQALAHNNNFEVFDSIEI
jgi:hypothetical protein